MAIELATQYSDAVDELFTTESKHSLVTNKDFSWTGANTIKVYRISTSPMQDYGRGGPKSGNWSRYGAVSALEADTQSMTLRKDRSFTFVIDKLDEDETKRTMEASSALARQLREVVVPEVDTWVFGEMIGNAGTAAAAVALTKDNIYERIVAGTEELDNAEVPETSRCLIVTPATFRLMKESKSIIMETDITAEMRLKGVIGMVDGLTVIRVPGIRVPDDFGFMLCHQIATVAPIKLADYIIHENPPGINGSLVEGRINYDAFVLDNKAKALYCQKIS
jgi:hypothetical protein